MKKIILFVILILLIAGGIFAWMLFGPAVKKTNNEFLYIKTGSTISDVKHALVDSNFLNSTGSFSLAANLIGYTKVKPGKYRIKPGMSAVNLVRMLNNGQQTPVNFVITKIRTRESLAARINRYFECDSSTFMNIFNNNDSLAQYGLDTNTIMVAAMPYTYTLKWNSTPRAILKEFLLAYKIFWNKERKAKADSLGFTPEQISTIASIIEEETNKKEDKPNMASVYINRVRAGMPLQADPTLKFALKDFTIKRVLNVHKETVSPFNTYVNKGLPPGPICTPSVESIDAVLNSPKTKYYYFVASHNFDGSHIFTTDYSEHMKYARLYQKELNRRRIMN